MNITLRRAAKLRSKIEQRLTEIESDLRHINQSVNIYDPDPLAAINKAEQDFRATLARYERLSGVQAHLRGLISQTNSRQEVQIDVGLSFIAQLNKHLNLLRRVTRLTPRSDYTRLADDQITGRIAGCKEMAASGNQQTRPNQEFFVLSQETFNLLDQEEVRLKSLVEDTQDKLDAANATTMLALTENVVSVLRAEKLLPDSQG